MSPEAFSAIVAVTAAAAKLPASRRAAVFAKLALTPEDKLRVLSEFVWRLFFQKKNGEPTDQLGWIFAAAAVGPREVLPWDRAEVLFLLRCTIPRPTSLPPAMVARAVAHLANQGPLPAAMRGFTARAADAIEREVASDGPTRRAVVRLRELAAAGAKLRPEARAVVATKARGTSKARAVVATKARGTSKARAVVATKARRKP